VSRAHSFQKSDCFSLQGQYKSGISSSRARILVTKSWLQGTYNERNVQKLQLHRDAERSLPGNGDEQSKPIRFKETANAEKIDSDRQGETQVCSASSSFLSVTGFYHSISSHRAMLSFNDLAKIGDSSHSRLVNEMYSDLQASDPINIQYTSVSLAVSHCKVKKTSEKHTLFTGNHWSAKSCHAHPSHDTKQRIANKFSSWL
jgi:hypothetical protein